MNEEYENILKQLDDLPRKLNIEIRAIMLSNICLQEQNQKYKEVFDKANKWVRDYIDEWDREDEVWHDLNELFILLEKVSKWKPLRVLKNY